MDRGNVPNKLIVKDIGAAPRALRTPSSFVSPPSLEELCQLGATDYRVYCFGFFPNTFRQAFPHFADRIWGALDSDSVRLLNAQMYRGSSKTTTLRVFTSRRVAYGRSRTIVFVSAEERHAKRNLSWIKRRVEENGPWAKAFGLRKGKKWNEEEIEIVHTTLGISITILALGILGGIRGINIDDWRPDLIVVDDVITDSAATSKEQLDKIEDLILGALVNSLAPEIDTPGSKLVMLQTPFAFEDATMKALNDPQWVSVRQGCWTDGTKELDLHDQISVWPERFPTETLRQSKLAHMYRNKASLFAREFEVSIVTKENVDFDAGWLEYYDPSTLDKRDMRIVLAIDPVPPPSARETKLGNKGKDYEAMVVVGNIRDRYYLLDYASNRGHNPSWTLTTLFGLIATWRPASVRVESIQYQRTLAWIIRQEMQRRRTFVYVDEVSDKRKKTNRIVDALLGIASNHKLYVRRDHGDFIQQFSSHPNGTHDDIIDATASAVDGLSQLAQQYATSDDYYDDDIDSAYSDGPALVIQRGAP